MLDAPLLKVRQLEAFYGDFQALYGLDLELKTGQVVAIVGANGAGKSTLLNSIAGLMATRPEAIELAGERIGGKAPYQIVAQGIALVPEGRRLFPSLSVEENLVIGGHMKRPGPWKLARIYELFPTLAERRHHPATALSGGQQQMVAIGRALMSNPRVLLCDELSLGLAPIVVRDIYAHLRAIIADGVAAIIVEQDIQQALKIAGHLYCMLEGRIVLHGAARSLTRESIAAAYFGV
ncbi:ABC transporter ATP-binding protein [Methylocapsa sp. S129]|uniref:ABC transporter ATP-binding protein n=1 Tax=Methylocapsa sp. S129 TaxID=1641869 RepID=UPI00131E2F7A|nr:ABC transporter ATP-binding protein [Methylocapsa sp. S129]